MGILGMGTFAPYREIDAERSFDVEKTSQMQIDMAGIPVHVLQVEAGSEIKCHLYGKARRGIELVSETNGNTVVIHAMHKLDGLPIEDVSLDVHIPANYGKDLTIKTTSGIIKVDSVNLTKFVCMTSSGGLDADKLIADLLTINSTSGSIQIKDLDARELKIVGTSSNITINYRMFDNQIIDITTTSGSTIVTLPSTAEYKYKVVTNGKFESYFPIDKQQKTGTINVEGAIGKENNQVLIHASSGNISLVTD